MAREWTRKSIEEIMRGVIAREGSGGTVDWVSELAKLTQNTSLDNDYPNVTAQMQAMVRVTSSSSLSIIQYPTGCGIILGKYVSGDIDNEVVYDKAYIRFLSNNLSYAQNIFQVGNIIDFYFEFPWYAGPDDGIKSKFIERVFDKLKGGGTLTSVEYGMQGTFSNANSMGNFKVDSSNVYMANTTAIPSVRFTVTTAPSNVDNSKPLDILVPA